MGIYNSDTDAGASIKVGPMVGWNVGAPEGAVLMGGPSALGAARYGIGIPKDSIMKYEPALKSDKFSVIAHGTADEVAMANNILKTTGAAEIDAHAEALATT